MAKCIYFIFAMAAFVRGGGAENQKFTDNAGSFSLDLFKNVVGEHSDNNVVLSPLSIHIALAMASLGAGGETATEMSRGLRLDSNRKIVGSSFKAILDDADDDDILRIANKIYLQDGFVVKSEFNTLAKEHFYTQAENVNFADRSAAVDKINNWVKDATEDKITNILDPNSIDASTKSVIVNAVYFKACWKNQFKEDNTAKENFWINENEHKEVDMMKGEWKISYQNAGSYSAIKLPYVGNQYSMVIALPKERNGLEDMEQEITNAPIGDLIWNLQSARVNVKLPKFKVEFKVKLRSILQKMGMAAMFGPKADFSNLTTLKGLKIHEVIHKAYIDVNEQGTEAAGASAIPSGLGSAPGVFRTEFNADHPFLYLIVDNEGIVYFMGRVIDP